MTQPKLEMHVETASSGEWMPFGSVAANEAPAVLANTNLSEPSETYTFGWLNDQGPGVWRSKSNGNGQVVVETIVDADALRVQPVIIAITGIKARFTYQQVSS